MNQLNYASLEASKRLLDAGIVLETEASWYENETGFFELDLTENYDYHYGKKIPAHSMAEVWRELPEGFEYEDVWAYLNMSKSTKKDGSTFCGYYLPNDLAVCGSVKHNTNPTDALIYLLIWVRKEKAIDAQEGANENKD